MNISQFQSDSDHNAEDLTEIIDSTEATQPYFLGVDVGGTNIKIGLVDNEGRTLGRTSIPTLDENGPEDAFQRAKSAADALLLEKHCHWDSIPAVGLGTPGSMDIPNGMILDPPNMQYWKNFPVRDCLSEIVGKPVSFANDANAAAFGEFWIGGGREHNSMVMLTLGTGVGGGIIYEGNLINGANSFGSECGHMIVDSRPDARLCVWGGGRGQLEAYASASGIVARAQDALDTGKSSSLNARIEAGEELTALMIYEEAVDGDLFALEVIDETAYYLGVGITTIVHLIDPGSIILGGAVDFGGDECEVGRRFLRKVTEEFQQLAYDVVKETHIGFAKLESHAGYIGAAGVARADWLRKNFSQER